MRPARRVFMLAAALLLAGYPSAPPAAAWRREQLVGLEQRWLVIQSGGRRHRFLVEVAGTPEQQARGLMFRTSLARDRGMVFPLSPPRPASFWMKNTLIPLDMIFIRTDGTIGRIAAMTRPLSLQPVSSGEPVAAVLEIAGGRSRELGIRAGDRVRW